MYAFSFIMNITYSNTVTKTLFSRVILYLILYFNLLQTMTEHLYSIYCMLTYTSFLI